MNFIKKYWIYATSIGMVLLLSMQVGFSLYRNHQAEKFVNAIQGYQADPIIFYDDVIERDVHADMFVHWIWISENPPSCPATLIGRYKHENGLSLIDNPIDRIPAVQVAAVHLAKNGQTSIEPIYSLDVAHAIKTHPGTWKYSIIFKFHCSIVNSEWLSFLKFDKAYETRPVLIDVEDNNDS